MKSTGFFVLAMIVALAAVFWWYENAHPAAATITNFSSSGTDVIAFGDSLIEGVGASPGNDLVSQLQNMVGQRIINLGRGGDTSADGLARIGELDQYSPQVVIVLFGGNDALRHVDPDETFANLAAIIQNIEQRGASVVLLGIRGGVLSDPYAARFQSLAKTYHTAYVPDVLNGVFGHADLMSDEVHPNDFGYQHIAERVITVLAPLVH